MRQTIFVDPLAGPIDEAMLRSPLARGLMLAVAVAGSLLWLVIR